MSPQSLKLSMGPRSAVVPAEHIHDHSDTKVAIVPPSSSDEHPAGATVELVKDGDLVLAIDVTCACGERIRLRCVYDDG